VFGVIYVTKKRTRFDLVQLVSLAENGIIDFDHMERWDQFKKEGSDEDVIFWNKLKDRVRMDESGALNLDPPLSLSEKLWAKMIARRVEERGLC
jgi:hypothetical protein